MSNFLETYGQYIDKAKLFKSTLNLIGMSPSDIASEEFLQILDEIEKGTYQQSNHQQAEEEDDEGGGSKW
jgi:hypothetical protein